MIAANEKSESRRSGRRAAALGAGAVGTSGIAVGALLLAAIAFAPAALGQRIYRWTDEKGTVHFSQEPPANVKDYEVKDLPVSEGAPTVGPAAAPPTAGAPAPSEGTPSGATPAASPAKTPVSPEARVDVVKRESVSNGNGVQEISGEVENKGGSAAHDVVVTVAVTETVQGAECLKDEIPVEPATLEPGETGTFSGRFENPCFYGPTKIDLQADWR